MKAQTRSILIIPDFNPETCYGQLRLNELIRQADKLTDSLNEIRAEGYTTVTFEMVMKRAEAAGRIFMEEFDPALFSYTGRRIIPNEERFFSWYQATPEGQANRARLNRYCPGSFGRFAKFDISL